MRGLEGEQSPSCKSPPAYQLDTGHIFRVSADLTLATRRRIKLLRLENSLVLYGMEPCGRGGCVARILTPAPGCMETAKIWRGDGIRRICYGNYQHTVTDITIERNCDVNTGNVVEITYEVPKEDELGTQPEMGTRTDLLSGVRKLRDEDRAGGTLL